MQGSGCRGYLPSALFDWVARGLGAEGVGGRVCGSGLVLSGCESRLELQGILTHHDPAKNLPRTRGGVSLGRLGL